MSEAKVRTMVVAGPLDLRATLGPIGLSWSRRDEEGFWRTMRTPEGPATMLVRWDETSVMVTAWGVGSDWILDHSDNWIGLHDDPRSFHTKHRLVGELARRKPGARFGRTGLMFEALLMAIIGQKVTGREMAMALRGLTQHYGGSAPGPTSLSLPPDPARIAELAYHDLHEFGVEKRRAATLIGVARRVGRIERLATEPVEEARRVLAAFPGVGPWTIAETTVVSHGDPDAVSVGDFHLKHLVSWHLDAQPRGTDERMLELLEEFRPHRGRVVRLLEAAGPYPKYGPRRPIRSIRTI